MEMASPALTLELLARVSEFIDNCVAASYLRAPLCALVLLPQLRRAKRGACGFVLRSNELELRHYVISDETVAVSHLRLEALQRHVEQHFRALNVFHLFKDARDGHKEIEGLGVRRSEATTS